MASYDWIKIDKPKDYERLLRLLDGEFGPDRIVEKLKVSITSRVKAVLVEHNYVDKDYRSTFYNFYAKKGRKYRADCVRLHFFDELVVFNERLTNITSMDERIEDHYFGYIVLRPTIHATLGRSVFSPDIRLHARGRAIQALHHVHLLGNRLTVWGFPSMDQHVDIAVCAHIACWAILRHYSESYSNHQEYLVHDITRLATPFDPGGISPSLGLEESEAERVLNAAGCFPVIVGRSNSANDDEFFSQLLAYLESGFPLFVAMHSLTHAIVVAGYSWRSHATKPTDPSCHVWRQVDTLLTVDDNLLPYVSVPMLEEASAGAEPRYNTEDFDSFIVALPEKIFFPADAIAKYCKVVESMLTISLGLQMEVVQLHRYFMTTISGLRGYTHESESQLGNTLVGLTMRLDTAQFVWVVEFSSVGQWEKGHISARAIVDATASPGDTVPIWLLHTEEVAFVFDRSTATLKVQTVDLKRNKNVPLIRMEKNLRPVRE